MSISTTSGWVADDQVDGLRPVGGAADDLQVGRRLEQHLEPCADEGQVVDDRDADHRAFADGPSGSSTVSRNPPPGTGSAWTVPSNSAARSRIPVRP